jgi:8-oxo-dGTP diphosphatase
MVDSPVREPVREIEKKTLRVVAALIRRDGRVLLSQRRPGRHLGLTWEFPGGKVEPGESDEDALRRELAEELGVEVEVGSLCFETRHGYAAREVHLLVYRCNLIAGEPRALEVNAVDWVEQEKVGEREFPPADMPLVNGLAQGMIPLEDPADEEEESEEEEVAIKPAKVLRMIKLPPSNT